MSTTEGLIVEIRQEKLGLVKYTYRLSVEFRLYGFRIEILVKGFSQKKEKII